MHISNIISGWGIEMLSHKNNMFNNEQILDNKISNQQAYDS